jgi:putative hydrolase of the HAD superfamily
MPSLDALASSGTRLGIISNWDERLRILLKDLRLEKYFEAIVISCDVGFAKPSPVIFEHAAEKLGVSPAAILHVGDSTEMDVAGAKSAGFQAARIRRAGSRSDPEISSLMMLPLRLTPHKSR